MTNYYKELMLDAQASAAELIEELIKQETLWHRRELQRPEEAARKLLLIGEAKKVFANESSKRAYDLELNAPKPQEEQYDPAAERRAQFNHWRTSAENYLSSHQYDLAKTAVEKALSYDSGENDAGFQDLAARIYCRNGDTSMALSRINKAIVLEPNEASHLFIKGLIYEAAYLAAKRNYYRTGDDDLAQMRQMLQAAQNLADRTGDKLIQARAMGYEAFSWQYYNPTDSERAGRLAEEAVRLGDDWGNAKNVLDDIAEKKAAAEKAERERIQREKEQAERWKNLQEERELQKQAEAAIKEAKDARQRRARLYSLLGLAGLLFSLVAVINDLFTFLHFIPNIPAPTLDVIALVSMFAVVYSVGGECGYPVAGYSALYAFMATTEYYTEGGYNAASAANAWKHLGIFLACSLAVYWIGNLMGKRNS